MNGNRFGPMAPGHHAPAFNVAHLIVEDVDTLHARCVAAGARTVEALADKDHAMRLFVFADPDGNCIDVGTPD